MLNGLIPARTDFFTGFMLKKNSKKLLYLFLNLVFPKKVFEVTLFYGRKCKDSFGEYRTGRIKVMILLYYLNLYYVY